MGYGSRVGYQEMLVNDGAAGEKRRTTADMKQINSGKPKALISGTVP